MTKKATLLTYLHEQGTPQITIDKLTAFRKLHSDEHRGVTTPQALYLGGTLNIVLSALLADKNIILVGDKGCGKNVLAETVALLLRRPLFEVAGHVLADAAGLLGEKTLTKGEITFEKGPVVKALEEGGVLVLDEINMMRPECMAVLHSVLDKRKRVDVPGYGTVTAHPAFRVVGTMNVGYAGTQELNEALVDRFVVIHTPSMTPQEMAQFLQLKAPGLNDKFAEQTALIFKDVSLKAKNAEITTKTVTLRGLIDALDLIKAGIKPQLAFNSCVADKAFDQFERKVVSDIIATRISEVVNYGDMFQATPATELPSQREAKDRVVS